MQAPSEYWLSLIGHAPLGILTDLDGTLLPFANTPDAARPTPEVQQLVEELAALPEVELTIVSGRPRATLDEYFPRPRSALLVAEHGAWRNKARWESTLSLDPRAVDSLAAELRELSSTFEALLLERKTWSLALHFRRVPEHRKSELLVLAAAIVQPWLETHPDFEQLVGAEVVEIRPRLAHKGSAVDWARERLGPSARLIVVGDDVTDEDMFSAVGEGDAAVVVNDELGHPTRAKWMLRNPDETYAFFRAIVALRRDGSMPAASSLPIALSASTDKPHHLLILSNRLPELRSADASLDARKRSVGGLVSALAPVLAEHQGIWLGWSGRTRPDAKPAEVDFDVVGGIALAWVDFPEEWQHGYYNGVSNGALWPLFHSFPSRVRFSHGDWAMYRRANESFASVAATLVGPDDTIWVHDYHLLLLGKFLRVHGHRGPVGFFQHVPFSGPDIFFLLPWAMEVLDAMLDFDLVGFHTQGSAENFLHCMAALPGARIDGSAIVAGPRRTCVSAFPLGIIPEDFQEPSDNMASDEIRGLMRAVGSSRLVLGVDRLDYTKGIPERIEAFGHLLELFPQWRRNVCLVQVSVPSRADIPAYAEQRTLVENSVGRINGGFGDADWVPIRYLYRYYNRKQLSELYRVADVGYVTPLRDGMNLVAKEFVAAQDPEKPGVLLLSRFAGAAEELRDAVLTNPWDAEGMARALDFALRMPRDERKRRHAALLAVIERTTALTWAQDFLAALRATRERRDREVHK
jgi:alpha,alpha-trehalose-phosphate synthase [UDP-forming]/trehalose-phosphatase